MGQLLILQFKYQTKVKSRKLSPNNFEVDLLKKREKKVEEDFKWVIDAANGYTVSFLFFLVPF
jgi:hypothetical protein